MNLREELNPQQYEAVTYCDGPSLVVAGAGSGKTRVLTYKVAYLLSMGVPAWSILSLTFTNKAAREMNQRIEQLVGPGTTRYIWSGTFHSVFARILRKECAALGYTSQFTIYDEGDSQTLIKHIVRQLGLDDKVYKPSKVKARISDCKNRLILPEAYENDRYNYERDRNEQMSAMPQIYRIYCESCKRANAMDFDDLLVNTYLLLTNHPDICDKYAERFQYVLVDEYQDTNYVQHQIVLLLTRVHQRVCVVGDDAQSIYSFRGANIDNVLGFIKQFPNAKLIKLEQNYRSTQTIVNAANSIISHNRSQIPKQVFSKLSVGSPLIIMSSASDKEESLKIAHTCLRLMRDDHVSPGEIAILYRTNAQSRALEEGLRDSNVPYRVYGGQSFYERKEIRDVIAYFRLACNRNDDEALLRIVNFPARGIGATTMGRIAEAAAVNQMTLWDTIDHAERLQLKISNATLSKLRSFQSLVEGFAALILQLQAYEAALQIVNQTGILQSLREDFTLESMSRIENVEELLNSVKIFQDELIEQGESENAVLTNYLANVALLTDADRKDDGTERVNLMTVHSAKGLEFDTVFVAGLEDDLFPNASAKLNLRDMEEERRLFYVAVTRAKVRCYLTYAQSRYHYGRMEFGDMSEFIKEIDPKYVKGLQPKPRPATFPFGKQQASTDFLSSGRPSFTAGSARNRSIPVGGHVATAQTKPASGSFRMMPKTSDSFQACTELATAQGQLRVGSVIEHDRFGRGVVQLIEKGGDSSKIEVKFEHVGTKKLLLRFAKFKIVD